MSQKEKTKKVPELRFPEFSGEWEEKKLGNLADIYQPKTITQNDLLENGEYKVYGANGIIGKYNKYNHKEQQVIVTCRGSTCGTVIITQLKSWITGNAMVININNSADLNKLFLFNYLKNDNLLYLITGSGQPQITSDIKQHKIKVPILKEQQKIADFLSKTDEWIDNLKNQKEKLEEYKIRMTQKIFSREVRFKDNNGKDFPDWEEENLGEVGKLQNGYAFKSKNYSNDGIPIIRISNISNDNNGIDKEDLKYYPEIDISERYIVKSGDLLIAMSGATTGKVSVYDLNKSAYLNQRVGLFKTNNNRLKYGFLIQVAFSEIFSRQLNRVLVAGAQPNISASDVEGFKIPLPSPKEQQKIAEFLTSINNLMEQKEKQISKAETWKKGLMQKIFF